LRCWQPLELVRFTPVVFGGFGYGALAHRIEDTESKIIVTADVGCRRGNTVNLKTVVDEALKTDGKKIEKVVVLKRDNETLPMKPGRDLFWDEALDGGKDVHIEVEKIQSNEPAFILYTSGTTANPKGTVQPHGSYQVYVYAMGKWAYACAL